MVRDTPPFQDASTHQIWYSYLKEYRRYAPDTKRDGRTDSAITICLPKFLWGHKNKCVRPGTATITYCRPTHGTVRKWQSMITACKALSYYFLNKFCFTLPTAETLKKISEYDQEIPQPQTTDKLKFKGQVSESRLTMKVSDASKTCYEKVHSTSTWKDILHIHRFRPSDFLSFH